jgi:hypothetical protein
MGVPPHQIMDFVATYEQNAEKPSEEWSKTEFTLEVPMNHLDLVRPKYCTKCKKLFFRGGKKSIHGDRMGVFTKSENKSGKAKNFGQYSIPSSSFFKRGIKI